MLLDEAISGRRSIRHFARRAVPPALVREIVAAACLAPAPHHTHPWRFVALRAAEAKQRLAEAMGQAWRRDLEADGVPAERIQALLSRSRKRLSQAPVLLLACIVADGARRWPDQRRRAAERQMFGHSLGAALQNLMLAAHARGLGTCWLSAPLFCPQAVRRAVDLPADFQAQALIALGYPKPGLALPPRPPLTVGEHIIE